MALVSPRQPNVESVTSMAVADLPLAENETLSREVAGPPKGGAMNLDIVIEFGASSAMT